MGNSTQLSCFFSVRTCVEAIKGATVLQAAHPGSGRLATAVHGSSTGLWSHQLLLAPLHEVYAAMAIAQCQTAAV
jgi:hypothetical protein